MKEDKRQPLIGKKTVIVDAKNQSLIGIEGTIVDETTHTITVDNKTIQKNAVTMKLTNATINGCELLGTYLRIKKG